MKPFAGDRFVLAEVAKLCALHKVESIIETGTQTGATTRVLSLLAERVYTVDIMDCGPGELPLNVEEYIGDSVALLPRFLQQAKGIVLLFLDAHEYGVQTTIRGELEAIAASQRWDSIIVIHDFVVPTPNSNLGFDTYPDGPLDLKYISVQLEPFLKRGYRFYFNHQAEGDRRGVLYLTPEPK